MVQRRANTGHWQLEGVGQGKAHRRKCARKVGWGHLGVRRPTVQFFQVDPRPHLHLLGGGSRVPGQKNSPLKKFQPPSTPGTGSATAHPL